MECSVWLAQARFVARRFFPSVALRFRGFGFWIFFIGASGFGFFFLGASGFGFFLKCVVGLFSCQGPAGCRLGLGFRAKSLTPHPKLYCRLSGVRSWSLCPCACNVQARKVVTVVMSRIVII